MHLYSVGGRLAQTAMKYSHESWRVVFCFRDAAAVVDMPQCRQTN